MNIALLGRILNEDPPVRRRHLLALSVAALLSDGVFFLSGEAEARLNIKNHFIIS